jgi:hypothetical protein
MTESPVTSTYVPPPVAAPPAKKSGCLKWGLIGCGSLIVLGGIFVVVLVVVVFGAMKKSDVYKEALSRAQNSPAVQAALGTPIEAGMLVSGSFNVDATGGHATLDFPISGPKGKGVVHVVATKSGDKWEYNTMTVKPENGPIIDLLAGMSPPASTETTTTTDTSSTTSTTGTTATTDTASTDTATTATSSTSTQ